MISWFFNNTLILIYFSCIATYLGSFDNVSSFLDATSNSAIVHHCMLPYKMAPISLFIYEKRHLEKGLLAVSVRGGRKVLTFANHPEGLIIFTNEAQCSQCIHNTIMNIIKPSR